MLGKKAKKSSKKAGDATRASVKKEMAQPRMAKSARKMLSNLAVQVPSKSPLCPHCTVRTSSSRTFIHA